MIADKFTLLLEDLSKHLSIKLAPDENNSCLINIHDKIEIQLQLEPTETYLIIGSILGELPPGKFREDTLISALTANARPYPRLGTFAYSKKVNSLILFEKIEVEIFDVENILGILTPFIKKAITWKDALDNGRSAPTHEENYLSGSDTTNFFGE